MRRALHIIAAIAVTLLTAPLCRSQDIRLANGVTIKGEVKQATAGGLEVQTPTGLRTYTWETLSTSTRFRYQPLYRANFDAILQGLPPSARTNAPVIEKPAPAVTPAPVAVVTSAPAPAAVTPSSLIIFDQAQYDNVEPINTSQIPGLQLRAADQATYLGIQYGPAAKDVAYLVFDTKSAGEPRDALFIYSPTLANYNTPVRIGGFKKSVGEERVVSFKKFKLNGVFGQIAALFDIECSYSVAQTNGLNVLIFSELSKGDIKSRFLLQGQMADLVQGDGVVNTKGVIDLPVLWLGLDLVTGAPRLVGNLNMSHLRFVPKEGMDSKVIVTITDEKGAELQREAIKLDDSSLTQPYGIVCNLKKVTPGQPCLVKASIDLGPFLGSATFEEKITVPAR